MIKHIIDQNIVLLFKVNNYNDNLGTLTTKTIKTKRKTLYLTLH